MTLLFDKKVAVGMMGMLVVVAFWISPEIGLVALAGVMLLSLIFSLCWLLRRRKREQVGCEAAHACPVIKARSSGSVLLSIAVEHSQMLLAFLWQGYA